MNSSIGFLFFLFYIIIVKADSSFVTITCSRNEDCIGKNLVCNDQNKCDCKPGYRYEGEIPFSKTQPVCINVIGSNCKSNDECKNLKGAICEKDKCICEGGVSISTGECLQVDYVNETCTIQSQCVRILDENAECGQDQKCKCRSGYHRTADKKCLNDANIGDDCDNGNSDKCYLLINNENALECREHKCHCKSGYEEIENTCKGGAGSVIISMLTMVFLVFGVLRVW